MFNLGQQEHWSSESLRDPSWWKLHLDKYCLQGSIQQWKLTVTGRFYCCSKILTPSALCGQSVLFCTKDSGLGHVTYFGEWNMAEGTMCPFWAEILRDITVSANSLTLLYSTMRRIFPRYPLLLQWGSWNESYMKQTWTHAQPNHTWTTDPWVELDVCCKMLIFGSSLLSSIVSAKRWLIQWLNTAGFHD